MLFFEILFIIFLCLRIIIPVITMYTICSISVRDPILLFCNVCPVIGLQVIYIVCSLIKEIIRKIKCGSLDRLFRLLVVVLLVVCQYSRHWVRWGLQLLLHHLQKDSQHHLLRLFESQFHLSSEMNLLLEKLWWPEEVQPCYSYF